MTTPSRRRRRARQGNRRRHAAARKRALRRAGGRCEACGAGGLLQVHHKRPLAKGGHPHSLDNIEVLCPACHDAAHGR